MTVTLDALDRAMQARVGEIVPAVDAASRSYIVKIGLPAVPQLRSGIYGRAVFTLGNRSVLAVPAGAITEQGQLRSVLVVEGGVARARLVTLGEARQDRREVLSGLTAGEKSHLPGPGGPGGRRQSGGPAVSEKPSYGIAGKLTAACIESKLTPLIIVAAMLLGAFAVWQLPREEEPQIIVPMIDVFVADARRVGPKEVEERVTKPMEKLLWEIPGVEYIYSTSQPGDVDGHRALLRGPERGETHRPAEQKMLANFDLIPAGRAPAADQAALD